MRISDWSSDVCSSDLKDQLPAANIANYRQHQCRLAGEYLENRAADNISEPRSDRSARRIDGDGARALAARKEVGQHRNRGGRQRRFADADADTAQPHLPIGPGARAQSGHRSEEHTSELPSLTRLQSAL